MKRLLILPAILLTGCLQTVPVKMSFPQVPEDLLQACPDLQQLDTNTKRLSDVVATVSKNYGQYQECQVKVDGWIQWYNTQKKIYEDVK